MKWANGNCVDYRVGAEGKVDLVASTPFACGYYYPDALPVLKSPSYKPINVSDVGGRKLFAAGDQVKIAVDLDQLREAQDGHGDWNPEMSHVIRPLKLSQIELNLVINFNFVEQAIGAVGIVRNVIFNDNIIVMYPEMNRKWVLNSSVLERINPFSIGSAIRIRNDVSIAMQIAEEMPEFARQLGVWVTKSTELASVRIFIRG